MQRRRWQAMCGKWVHDPARRGASTCVLRGGSWNNDDNLVRSALRALQPPRQLEQLLRVPVCPLASILTFWFLVFWVSGKRGDGGRPAPLFPAKPVNIFVFDWFSQEGVGGGGLSRTEFGNGFLRPLPSTKTFALMCVCWGQRPPRAWHRRRASLRGSSGCWQSRSTIDVSAALACVGRPVCWPAATTRPSTCCWSMDRRCR
jgi:hypothetical protein